jgi:hypothetical protein
VDLLLAATTLSELKQFIIQQVFPCLEENRHEPIVRIFHLGRELKSVQRTLEKLGVGRYRHNAVLHVHILQSEVLQPQEQQQTQAISSSKRRTNKLSRPVTGLMTNPSPGNKPIIELLDDNDDDHDSNDETVNEVLVIEPPTKKQRI